MMCLIRASSVGVRSLISAASTCHQETLRAFLFFKIEFLLRNKVGNPYSVTFLIRISIVEWHVVWCGSNNGYQNDMF